ncbi:MAG TPA: GNAT family N-acetyltransferase [Caldimonas sp.]
MLGFVDEDGEALVGMASVVADLIAEHVWLLGLFIVASSPHGSGAAQALYRRLERWMVERGAQWIHLGVVAGNAKAERFWLRSGDLQGRERGQLEMGRKSNLLRVLVKPLAGGAITTSLDLVTRERPGAP